MIYLTLLCFIFYCTLVSNAKGNIAKSNKSELWNLAKVEQGSYKNRIGHRHNLKLIFTLIMSKGGKKNCYAGADTACCQEEIGKHVVSLAISRCIQFKHVNLCVFVILFVVYILLNVSTTGQTIKPIYYEKRKKVGLHKL